MRIRVLIGSFAVLVALAGCSTDKTLSASDLQKRVAVAVKKETGTTPTNVKCGDLKAKVDATTSCTLTLDGKERKLTVTTTKVNGDSIKFSYKEVA